MSIDAIHVTQSTGAPEDFDPGDDRAWVMARVLDSNAIESIAGGVWPDHHANPCAIYAGQIVDAITRAADPDVAAVGVRVVSEALVRVDPAVNAPVQKEAGTGLISRYQSAYADSCHRSADGVSLDLEAAVAVGVTAVLSLDASDDNVLAWPLELHPRSTMRQIYAVDSKPDEGEIEAVAREKGVVDLLDVAASEPTEHAVEYLVAGADRRSDRPRLTTEVIGVQEVKE